MKAAQSIAFALIVLVLAACGGSDGSTDERMSKEEIERVLGPQIVPPQGPPPKEVVFEDLRTGSGPAAERGDRVAIHYVAVHYETGRKFSIHWLATEPAVYPRLGFGPYIGLERGIAGMKVGGEREVIVPSRLAFNRGTLVYIVRLASLEAAPKRAAGNGA